MTAAVPAGGAPASQPSPPANAPRRRDAGIDALRGLAIMLVVLGHALVRATPAHSSAGAGLVAVPGVGWIAASTAASPLLELVYSFHIPLFAFVSGMVMVAGSRGYGLEFLKRRFLALMVPYFAWLFIGWLSIGEKSVAGLARFMTAGALDSQAPGSLWFLFALFMSCAVLALVKRVSASDAALAASAVVVGLIGAVPVGRFEHTLALGDVAWVYPFLVAGLLFAARRERFDALKRIAWPVSAAVWLGALPLVAPLLIPGPRWWFGPVEAVMGGIGLPGGPVVAKAAWALARVAGALGGVLTVYYAYGYVKGRAQAIQAWVGVRSIGIYALQSAFLLPLAAPWGLPRVLVLFALAMAGSVLATLVLERFMWSRVVLLGRRG